MWILLYLACSAPQAPTELSVTTYNAGLAVGFVPGAETRVDDVAAALAAHDSDVICLQEVWLPEQVAAIQAATADWPHQIWPEPQQSSDAVCNDGELDSFAQCMDSNCTSTCIDEVTDCALGTCPIPFVSLPLDCMRCVMANVGSVDSGDALQENCESSPAEYAYTGSFGTAILSRYAIASTNFDVFASTANRRGLLHAKLDVSALPQQEGDEPDASVDVYCTHLTPVFRGIPFPREEGGWEEEQRDQMAQLNVWVDAWGSVDEQVLLGDLNAGPEQGPDNVGEAVANWDLLLEAGWSAPYLDGSAECTFCADNPLVDSSVSGIIDHVLIQGIDAVSAERVLDESVDAERCGDPISPGALSDHYGVRAVLDLGLEVEG